MTTEEKANFLFQTLPERLQREIKKVQSVLKDFREVLLKDKKLTRQQKIVINTLITHVLMEGETDI